jgi:hypothetical protein
VLLANIIYTGVMLLFEFVPNEKSSLKTTFSCFGTE